MVIIRADSDGSHNGRDILTHDCACVTRAQSI